MAAPAVDPDPDAAPVAPGIAIELSLEDERWSESLGGEDGVEALAADAAGLALKAAGIDPQGWSVSFLFADDDVVTRLNESFRGKATPTNVLSWPAHELRAEAADGPDGATPAPPPSPVTDGPWGDEPESLGDVALAWETVAAEAEAQGLVLADHVRHLALHGTLHLLGYDHEREGDARLMEGLERQALLAAGHADPYLAQERTEARPDAGAKKARSDGR